MPTRHSKSQFWSNVIITMKKSPEERKSVILDLLKEAGRLSVDTLVETLGVSAMTVNRDIRELATEKKIRRMHGLILPPGEAIQAGNCALCRQEISERTQFLCLCTTGNMVSFCCPHCGLAQLRSIPMTTAIFATDYLYGTLVDAYSVTYLIGSRISLCCFPSVLCFRNPEDAASFRSGFGGELFSLGEAAQHLFPS